LTLDKRDQRLLGILNPTANRLQRAASRVAASAEPFLGATVQRLDARSNLLVSLIFSRCSFFVSSPLAPSEFAALTSDGTGTRAMRAIKSVLTLSS
jgi:hypothetical protein